MTPLSHDWHPPIVELLQNISLLLTLTADSALEHVPVASFGRIKSNGIKDADRMTEIAPRDKRRVANEIL